MKRLTLLLLFALAGCSAFAQSQGPITNKLKAKHMLITIIDDRTINIGRKPFNMFVTRDDTAQIQTYLDFNLHVKNRDVMAAHEQQIMNVLSVYYAQGWKLVSVSIEKNTETVQAEVYRYFLVKNE